MDNLELIDEQIQQELDELSEGDDSQGKSPQGTKTKKLFVQKTKEEIDKLSRREQYEYKIKLSKSRTEELKNELREYQQRESKASRSRETKRLIILGRFLETVKNNPDRKVQYKLIESWLDQYLTNNRDRDLLGFPRLADANSDAGNHDNN